MRVATPKIGWSHENRELICDQKCQKCGVVSFDPASVGPHTLYLEMASMATNLVGPLFAEC
jgi:uncharacterized OB-fold protein